MPRRALASHITEHDGMEGEGEGSAGKNHKSCLLTRRIIFWKHKLFSKQKAMKESTACPVSEGIQTEAAWERMLKYGVLRKG